MSLLPPLLILSQVPRGCVQTAFAPAPHSEGRLQRHLLPLQCYPSDKAFLQETVRTSFVSSMYLCGWPPVCVASVSLCAVCGPWPAGLAGGLVCVPQLSRQGAFPRCRGHIHSKQKEQSGPTGSLHGGLRTEGTPASPPSPTSPRGAVTRAVSDAARALCEHFRLSPLHPPTYLTPFPLHSASIDSPPSSPPCPPCRSQQTQVPTFDDLHKLFTVPERPQQGPRE